MPARYQFARRKAIELLDSCSVTTAPIAVEEIAAKLNAVIRHEPFPGELSGMVHRRPDGTAVIGVNSLHPQTRKRFTIAHEIAHLVLHEGEEFHIDDKYLIGLRNDLSSTASDDNEIEANQFAAELLMPKKILFVDLANMTDELEPEEAIRQIAAKYMVSVQAMTIRLHSLGIIEEV